MLWRSIIVPLSIILVIGFSCAFGPLFGVVPDAVGGSPLDALQPAFSKGHLLGTDVNGNDTFARLLYGGRTSLGIASAVNIIGLLVGATVGALGAQLGRLADLAVVRSLDVMIAIPSLVFVLVIAQAFGPSKLNTIAALSFFSVPAFGRLARAATLRLREQPFMIAATLAGTGRLRVLLLHIAPNLLPQLITFACLGMGAVITIEGALSFLGLGIRPPDASWGNMISQGQQVLQTSPATVLWPSGLLFLTVLSLTLIGERLRRHWSHK
jgi:peptide/nickel transport system permease protein